MTLTSPATGTHIELPDPGDYWLEPAFSSIRVGSRNPFGRRPCLAVFRIDSGVFAVCRPLSRSSLSVTFSQLTATSPRSLGRRRRPSAATSPLSATFDSAALHRDSLGWILHGDLAMGSASTRVDLALTQLIVTPDGLGATATATVSRSAFPAFAGWPRSRRRLHLSLELTALTNKPAPDDHRRTMTRIALPNYPSLPTASREILNEIVGAGQSRIIDLQTGMAISTPTLAAYWAMRKAMTQHATLEPKTRYAIMLATAAADETEYSQRLNTHLALSAGWSPTDVLALQHGVAPEDPKLTSLLQLTQQAARDHGRVTDGAWNEAHEHGWQDDQLLEAITHVALVGLVDLVANLLQLDPEGVAQAVFAN